MEPFEVEGHADSESVGEFSGRVLAIGVQGTDPVAIPKPELERTSSPSGEIEGLVGWGTTTFLIADPSKPAPVWVTKNEITSHRMPEAAGQL
jgi:hypothetical protein